MLTNRLAVFVVAPLITAAAISAVLKFSAAARANAESAAIDTQRQRIVRRIAQLESQLQKESTHIQDVEADNVLLEGALKKAQAAMTEKAAVPLTRQAVEDRFKRAQALVRTGDAGEALRELLACAEAFRK